ncbi:hypothetical protein I6I93_02190 [Peptoniphilus harei]|uniref:hypothetical protein n=1 Tax=Peptoniphilus harei TaxID=54005 RepID=UPI0019191E4F|nr:hypothetical protein [Peptoniphilus harei]QQT91416.1 hypothetical protein I6I93_02190 [Peptoniphilus harei]
MIETIICGKVSGNFIVESLFKLKDIIEISGIFEVNSTTIRDAYFNNLPLFTNIKISLIILNLHMFHLILKLIEM